MAGDDADKEEAAKTPRQTQARAGSAGSGNRSKKKSSAGSRPRRATEIARDAAEQLTELSGRVPEAVTALSRTDDGWQVEFEVLEIHRVPETADVMAIYQAELDEDCALVSYRRTRRYARGQIREE